MNPPGENADPADTRSKEEIETLLKAAEAGQAPAASKPAATNSVETSNVQPCDFRRPSLLSSRELRKLRERQDEFVAALAARLSLFLRLDVAVKLSGIQTSFYQQLAQSWACPTHLSLFKIEPLRGVCILETAPALGSAIVDRLMGGAGKPADAGHEFSEIEKALLEQSAQLVLGEWCAHWHGIKDLKPTVLGQESNGRFVQTAAPETILLVVSLEVRLGHCTDKLVLGFPYAPLQPLIQQLSQGSEAQAEPAIPVAAKTAPRWNTNFDDVCIPIRAEWSGTEMAARDVLALKVGDVVKLDPQSTGHVRVRVADLPRFDGRPGTIGGKWAVELTRAIKP